MRTVKNDYKNSVLFLKKTLPHSVVSIQSEIVSTIHLMPPAFHTLEFDEHHQHALHVMQRQWRLTVSKFK